MLTPNASLTFNEYSFILALNPSLRTNLLIVGTTLLSIAVSLISFSRNRLYSEDRVSLNTSISPDLVKSEAIEALTFIISSAETGVRLA